MKKEARDRPPSFIEKIKKICPKKLNSFPISTGVSPVTQTAEVAMNNLSEKLKTLPLLYEKGKEIKIKQIKIKIK